MGYGDMKVDTHAAKTTGTHGTQLDLASTAVQSGITKSRGVSYQSGAGHTNTPTAGSWYDLGVTNATFVGADLVDFTEAAGVLTYTGAPTKVFKVLANLYMRSTDAGNTPVGISINGADPIASNIGALRMGGVASTGSIVALVTLSTGDTVKVQTQALAGASGATYAYADLTNRLVVTE